MPKIAITEDHELIRKSLELALNQMQDVEVIINCGTGKELLEELKTKTVDIVLLDLESSSENEFKTIYDLATDYPYIKILAITDHLDSSINDKISKLPIAATIARQSDLEELEKAILEELC